jgi:hypothetical protein
VREVAALDGKAATEPVTQRRGATEASTENDLGRRQKASHRGVVGDRSRPDHNVAEVECLRSAGVTFRSEIIGGIGGTVLLRVACARTADAGIRYRRRGVSWTMGIVRFALAASRR